MSELIYRRKVVVRLRLFIVFGVAFSPDVKYVCPQHCRVHSTSKLNWNFFLVKCTIIFNTTYLCFVSIVVSVANIRQKEIAMSWCAMAFARKLKDKPRASANDVKTWSRRIRYFLLINYDATPGTPLQIGPLMRPTAPNPKSCFITGCPE